MRIWTKAGDLAFKTFTFPDGQPHFQLETYEREFSDVTVEMALKTPSDLFMVGLVNSVLRANGYSTVSLDVRYLMGARMDRAIDCLQPFTLDLVARTINSCGFSHIRILDCHSEVTTRLIRNSENVLPQAVVKQVRETLNHPWIVSPDKGAIDRVQKLCGYIHFGGKKIRDMQTGKLSGFAIDSNGVHLDTAHKQDVLIVDDICDGGATFTGLSKVLREAGAKKVYLYVTHGIFSKGLPLEGINRVFTTDSYANNGACWGNESATVIPISMKEMK